VRKSILFILVLFFLSGVISIYADTDNDYIDIVTGKWKTDWGILELKYNKADDNITGVYKGQFPGNLEGTIEVKEDNEIVLSFTWQGNNGEEGKGQFIWQADDDEYFEGTWGTNDSIDDGGEWNGSRM
jgi:hypothetical protein